MLDLAARECLALACQNPETQCPVSAHGLMQFPLKFFSVTTALAGFAGAALGQNLLVNGSFENTSTFVSNSEQIMSLQQGSTALLGWTVTDAEIAWAKDTNPYVPGAADGHYFLDLTGYHDRFPFGGIVQEISTVSGETYTLSFALGVHQGNPLYRGPIEVAAIAGPVSRSVYTALCRRTPNKR